mgnify:FL=1
MQSKLILDSGDIQLWLGNALRLDMLADDSVDLVVTSPNYNLGKMRTHNWNPRWYDQCEDAMPEDEYQNDQILVLKELYRVTKLGGSLALNHKVRHFDYETYHPLTWIAKTPWYLVQEIIWERPGTVNHFNGRFVDETERVYWLFKGMPSKKNPPYFNKECAEWKTIWRIKPENNRDLDHPAPFPVSLPYRCIEAFSRENDLILDPYNGSGSTAMAAKMLKRKFVGVDISEKYLEDAKLRLEQKTLW